MRFVLQTIRSAGPLGFAVWAAGASAQTDGIQPTGVHVAIAPGECRTIQNRAHLAAGRFGRADILFCMDVTNTMQEEITNLKNGVIELIQELQGLIVDPAFGLMSLRDYPSALGHCPGEGGNHFYGGSGDFPYQLNSPIDGDVARILQAVNTLPPADGGGDAPESYGLALWQAYNDPEIAWRSDSKKIIVSFGDNLPHDCSPGECAGLALASTGPDPGPDALVGTLDDLPILEVMDGLRQHDITLIHFSSSGAWNTTPDSTDIRQVWSCLAARTAPGGQCVSLTPLGLPRNGQSFSQVIRDAISAVGQTCGTLSVRCLSPLSPWVQLTPGSSNDVLLPQDFDFSEAICPPVGTAPGRYVIPLVVDCDADHRVVRQDTVDVLARQYPENGFLGIYADAAATLCQGEIPTGGSGTLHLVATLSGPAADFLNGAAFRLEITHPEGYIFTYSGPDGVEMKAAIDDTPGVADARGVIVNLPSCPAQPRADGRFAFGEIGVTNDAGGTTEILVRRMTPGTPELPAAPAFSICGSAPGWMSMTTSESALSPDPVAFRLVLNGQQAGTCGPVAVQERSWSGVKRLYH